MMPCISVFRLLLDASLARPDARTRHPVQLRYDRPPRPQREVSSLRLSTPDIGRLVYGLAGVVLGIIGLVWQDFAAVWQPIENLGVGKAQRAVVACIFAACFLAAGAAAIPRRTAQIGVLALGALHLLSALGWIPRVLANVRVMGIWNGLFEQLALVAAGVAGYALLAPSSAPWRRHTIRIGCIVFGICAISFGVTHFTAIPEVVAFTPKWIPPGPTFWAWATGVFHLAAGLAIVSGVEALLAARLLTVMCIGFGVLVWAPFLASKSGDHTTWAGNAINLCLVGAAWLIADAISRTRR